MDKFSSLLKQEEKEVEYVYWLKVTEDTLERLMNQPKFDTFMDVLMVKDKSRFRMHNKQKIIFTKKVPQADGSKIEHNHNEVPYDIAMACTKYAENIHRVKRVLIPIYKLGTEEPLLRKSTGEQLHWEIDLFYTSKSGTKLLDWIKVELEVDSFNTNTLRNILPVDYLELIDEKDKQPEDAAIIANIWNKDSNVLYNVGIN